MLSAPHAFGIDGRAASGGRVNFNSGCPLDYEFGKPFTAGRIPIFLYLAPTHFGVMKP